MGKPNPLQDANFCSRLFFWCIRQALKEKITILVTHQWQILEDASQILILKNGEIIQKGTLVEFPKSGVDFEDILLKKKNEEGEPSPGPGTPSLNSESSVQFQQSPRPSLKDAAPEDQDAENTQVALPLEGHLVGKVGFKTYKNYFTACAHWFIIIFLILVNVTDQVLNSERWKLCIQPYNLLQNADILFYKMVQKQGEAEASALLKGQNRIMHPCCCCCCC